MLLAGCAFVMLWLLLGSDWNHPKRPRERLPDPALLAASAAAEQEQAKGALALEAERDRIDQTVWGDELRAEGHEQVFIKLWDELRSSADPFAALAQFPLGDLGLPETSQTTNLEHNISLSRRTGPGPTLTAADWKALLLRLKDQGYQLAQSEWRHAQFDPAAGAEPAKSKFEMTLHATNHQRNERIIVRGILDVRWAASPDPAASPIPEHIAAADLEILTQEGPPAFQHILEQEIKTELNPVFIDPLLVQDLNGDGLSEIVLAGQNLVYWNRGNGRFEPAKLCQFPIATINTAVIGDFNGDGFPDLLGADRDGDLGAVHETRLRRHIERGARQGHVRARPIAREFSAEHVRGADELVYEQRRRPVIDLGRRGHLLDTSARHHGDAVRHRERLLLVVRDQNRGDAVLALQPLHLDLHVEAQVLVERAKRLIEQQNLRIDREAARQRDALLLAAGELTRLALRELAHVHQRQHLGDARRDLLPWPFVSLQTIRDVFRHRHVREQRVVLEHDADAALARREVIDGLPVEQHAAFRLADEAGDDAQERGLAAAGRSEQRDHFAARYIQINVLDSNEIAEPLRDVFELKPVPAIRRHLSSPCDPGAQGLRGCCGASIRAVMQLTPCPIGLHWGRSEGRRRRAG